MANGGSRTVTAKDVARAAGVSQATVSYVINDAPNQRISPGTRERVLAAVRDLGYTPSAAARALRKGSSDVVLFVMPNYPIGPSVAALIEHLEEGLEGIGLGLVTRRIRQGRPVASLWREIMPAAVVTLAAVDPAEVDEMRAAGVFVSQALLTPTPDEATLSVPQTLIGRLQVEHLASTGHRHLGYADPARPQVEGFLRLRLEGVRMACVELGLGLPDVRPVPLDAEAATRAVQGWRDGSPKITAICAYNDEVAFAVLAGMRRLGLQAPVDLAVIGVDNIPLAPFAMPPLTTVDQHLGVVASHLVALIKAGIAGESLPRMPRSEAISLVVRESA